MGAELKKYRALVRLKEIKKTVQEQRYVDFFDENLRDFLLIFYLYFHILRLIFLQTQMKEIEELLN